MTRPSDRSVLRRPIRRALPLALAIAMGLAGAAAVQADHHEGAVALKAAEQIAYRQSVMSIIGTHMGAIGDLMKHGLAVPGAIETHAKLMAESAALIAPAFRARVTEGATDAKPEIWTDWTKFQTEIAEYEEAANALASAAASGDPAKIGPAMKALGGSCGGCHKPFRKPKEESYKNK
ncbi:MAG: cytochrome c [Spirochaetaceae bacterium]|nr:cytochrome c [Spirochaetaceae bacterium]